MTRTQNIFWWLPDGIRISIHGRKVTELSEVQQTAINWPPRLQTKETKTNWSRESSLNAKTIILVPKNREIIYFCSFPSFFLTRAAYIPHFMIFAVRNTDDDRVKFFHRNNGVRRSLKHFSISWENVIFYVNTEKHKAARLHDYACSSVELFPSPWTSREALR